MSAFSLTVKFLSLLKVYVKNVDLFQDFQFELSHVLFRIHFSKVLPHHLQSRNHLHHHTHQVKYEMKYLYFIDCKIYCDKLKKYKNS